jgi:hypothetical protein
MNLKSLNGKNKRKNIEHNYIMAESVENALNEYYKLKSSYETENLKNKKTIINNNTLSLKEKRSEFKKLKPKCVNCKRPGGTIFSIKCFNDNNGDSIDNNEYREFRASCGIIADPCNLNINIRVGKYESLQDILEYVENEIKVEKNNIINEKNKLLFGLITTDTAVKNFETMKDYVTTLSSLLDTYLKEYINITDNLERKKDLEKDIEMSYILIGQIKECIKNMDTESNTQYARDAVNIYVTSLKPLLKNIMNLKYRQNIVYYNEDNNTYNLLQNTNTAEALEITFFKNKVVSYDVGMKVLNNAPAKKIIIDTSSTEYINNDTKANAPAKKIIIDSSSTEYINNDKNNESNDNTSSIESENLL